MIVAERRFPAFFPATSAAANMVRDSGRQRQARLHRVVLQRHLEEQRQRDHRSAQRDLLEHLCR